MNIQRVLTKMFDLYSGDAKRIQHFTKVYTYASYIGREEGISEKEQAVLEIAAVVHDIGIHMCEEKYGECGGKLQEKEGPAIAKELLGDLDISADIIDKGIVTQNFLVLIGCVYIKNKNSALVHKKRYSAQRFGNLFKRFNMI